MKDKEVKRLLEKNGWRVDRVNGSHHIMKKGDKILSVPIHKREIPKGLLNKILKEAGLK